MRYTYRSHSKEKRSATASGGIFKAVSRIITVTKLAPATDGTAKEENAVKILKNVLNKIQKISATQKTEYGKPVSQHWSIR